MERRLSLCRGGFLVACIIALECFPTQAQLPSGGPWSLRFADEFDHAHPANQMGLDPDKWNPAYPWTRVHNYPAYIRDENIRVNTNNNGLLQLWGKRENFGGQAFTSGAVNSNGHLNLNLTAQSGYMEARMRFPRFTGAWPAFWSLQEGWPPEIDMMEFVLGGPNTSTNNYVANVHFKDSNNQNASSWSGFKNAGAGDLTAAFHNYGLRWTDDTLTWYIDGRQFHSYTGPAAIAQMQRMYLILNLGIGGWPGDPPATEDVNKPFDIDWVRVWLNPDAAQSTYTGPAGGNQNWDNSANWTSGAPKLASTTAVFATLSGPSVTLDWVDTKVVRGLTFRTGTQYRIGWADDLLMLSVFDSGSAATEALIDVQSAISEVVRGDHTIASRVELHSDTRVKNATADTLTFLSDIHGRGALTLDSGKTTFNGAVLHRAGTHILGAADASFIKALGLPTSPIHVGTTAGSNSTLRLTSSATTIAASHLRLGDAGGTGTLHQSGGSVTITSGEVWVGQGANSTGNYNHSAGALTLNNWLAIGRSGATGTYRLSGAAILNKLGSNHLIIGSLGGTGSFLQSGGTVNLQSGNTLLGEDTGASGAYTITAGTATLNDIILSQRGTGRGTFNLDGGTVTANRIGRAGTGVGNFNFNGGTLRPAHDEPVFMQGLSGAFIRTGGAIIDTDGHDITIAQDLVAFGSGRLTKNGPGTLTLTGSITMTDPAIINAGTLALRHPSGLNRLGGLQINSGLLDLGANDLIVSLGDPAALAQLIAAGKITGAPPNPLTTYGVGITGGQALVKHTYFGDADLDGRVTARDYFAIDRGRAMGLTLWANGDFNYSGGPPNADDYALIDRAFLGQGTPMAPAMRPAAVPEPALAAMAALAALAARRRSLP